MKIQQNEAYRFFNRTLIFSRWGKATDIRGRFGGGWEYNFGIQVGGGSIIINLIFGIVRIDKIK